MWNARCPESAEVVTVRDRGKESIWSSSIVRRKATERNEEWWLIVMK